MNSMDKEQNFIVEIKGEMCRLGYLLLISNLIKDTDGASSEKMARKLNPDYFFVTPWGFINEFVKRESKWLKKGGKFILPFPKFKLVKK